MDYRYLNAKTVKYVATLPLIGEYIARQYVVSYSRLEFRILPTTTQS